MSAEPTCPSCGAGVPVQGYEGTEVLHDVRPMEMGECPNGHKLVWDPHEEQWLLPQD